MIPRYQRILFWCLAVATLLMAAFLLHGCEQAREKLTRHRDETPLAAPVEAPGQTMHLAMANDADGSITMTDRQIALPAEPTARARDLLARLIAEYSYKNTTHPLQSGPAIDDVFLLELPLQPAVAANPAERAKLPSTQQTVPADAATAETAPQLPGGQFPGGQFPGGQLAVVNLRGSFAGHHPSGIEVETLTIQSIVGTLFANFPRIEQVRFLVDGQPHDTLAGHADLTRTYQAVNTATAGRAQ